MRNPRRFFLFPAVLAIAIAVTTLALTGRAAAPTEADVDKIFARFSATTPGCAVGIGEGGKVLLTRAYGMADLEHDVSNTADTIFEAGSVSKQFTAAAVLLLAREGKLSLDDPVRKYIPELPDYGAPLTIRHMLNHSSGLRDWGSVAGIGGWPRTSRAYTHAHVLEIVSRQRALNFPSGTRYSYSNSGYNLSAILVARVSGMSFADFTRDRIFKPLGMTRTSWRDDYRRIVKDRAIAYSFEGNGFRTLMPFENVHGNGGLLTTVGDLLKWNTHFAAPTIGDASFVAEQERPGRFNDGRPHGYALGLMVNTRRGHRQIAHSGSTAGYQAYLTRYPDLQHLSIAVLCNVSNANATQFANAVADLYLGDRAKTSPAPASAHTLTAAERAAAAGLYRSTLTGEALTIQDENGTLRAAGTALFASSPTRFTTAAGVTWEFDGKGGARSTDSYGTAESYERVQPWMPSTEQLQALAGGYVSDEAEVTLTAAVDGTSLVIKRRPDTTIRLTPIYQDAFSGSLGTVIFRRDGGRVSGMSVVQDRVWDLRFRRVPGGSTTSQ